MKHPTKQQIQTVINNFEKVLPQAKFLEKTKGYSIDMEQSNVYHRCNTPMCHAGWYAIAIGNQDEDHQFDFQAGLNQLETDLGFNDVDYLIAWAIENSNEWGNSNGREMFRSIYAFITSPGFPVLSTYTLQHIVDHWRGVLDRLPN